ncbi:GMC family oxidoreductase N-terminal domain-containing protein [Amycolatopsis anabasis]|uniref:GMC family oxidoreductase N-terminal domain-containing protein n=1 Tax=Amycolatopsis anabasis TaxID=1840409 RepID=UPI00131B02CF|nr:GMC family oxidoreductase N-terminal domain-containing protein [Amycolatopsis anabasis]
MRDVIVIGAGGGGPTTAKELAAQGLDVMLLEGGPRNAHPRSRWSTFENDSSNPLIGYLRFGPSDRSQPAWFREHAQNSFVWQLSGVGGSTQIYVGNSPRAYPGVFADYDGPDRNKYDVAHRFPFGYSEMVPYYEWVEATLPVQTAAMGTKEEVWFNGCAAAGLPLQTTKTTKEESYRPQENAILQPGGNAGRTSDPNLLAHPLATGCTFCGHCPHGCIRPIDAPRNLIAKRSTDNSYVPMAITAEAWARGGRPATLIADAFVTKIHTESVHGRTTATGVTWRDNRTGEHHREDAKVVVMAGGCIENPRLWFNSGLPNPNDWVGRGLTDHFLDAVTGVFPHSIKSTQGAGSAARADFPGRGAHLSVQSAPSLQAFLFNASDSGIRGHYTNGRGIPGQWDGLTGRTVGPDLKDLMMSGIDHFMWVAVLTDDDVEAQNRVVLSGLPGDAHGPVPKVIVQSRKRSARTVANRDYVSGWAAKILRAAGAHTVIRQDAMSIPLHVQSSMRMGHSAEDSVLDADGQARWVDRLFITDNSALPNALGGPNPTLSTQALATRTAERIFQLYFGGDPWVRTEVPVVSTDPRISARLAQLGL